MVICSLILDAIGPAVQSVINIRTTTTCKDFYFRAKKQQESKTDRSYCSDNRLKVTLKLKTYWKVFKLCTALSLLFLRSQLTPEATTMTGLFPHGHTLVYLSSNEEGNSFQYHAAFCGSSLLDQEAWHYKLGSRAAFVVAAWPWFLHPSGRERKTASLELHDLVSPLPVLGMRDPKMLSEAQWWFPTANSSKRSSMGHSGMQDFWGCMWNLAEKMGEKIRCASNSGYFSFSC